MDSRTLYWAIACCSLVAAQTCYFSDKSTIAEGHTPCNTSAAVSGCCYKTDLCLDNNLCLFNNGVYQGSCTDRQWNQGCTTYCPSMNYEASLVYCGLNDWDESLMSCVDIGCSDNFTLPGGSGVILREEQVAPLGLSDPVVIYADTSLKNFSSLIANTPSATATPSLAAGQGRPTGPHGPSPTSAMNAGSVAPHAQKAYTAKDMAAVGAGIGIPLALALACAIALLYKEKRSNKVYTQQNPTSPIAPPLWQLHSPISPDDIAQSSKPQEAQAAYDSSGRQELDTEPAQKSPDGPRFTIEA